MATPDPCHHWSGAPKQWVDVPAQRRRPPSPEQLDAAARRWPGWDDASSREEWSVAAVALAVAVAAFILVGTVSAITEHDTPPPVRTNGTSVR
ncbi:hypothetical protein ACU61A_20945 [Pseudonocardia sichuanensis]